MTLYSEIWGEIETPGTMMGAQTFIRDDHPGNTGEYTQMIAGKK